MKTRLLRWLLGTLVWTALALLSASQAAARRTLRDAPVNWGELIPDALVNWYSCAVFTPLFFWAARRWPIDTARWLRHTPLHLLLCAVASAGKFAIEREVGVRLFGYDLPPLLTILQVGFISENIAFWCMAGIIHAIVFQRSAREREVMAARLKAQLSEAQLQAMAARLHPHFLFNTLQGISTLLYRDPGAADVMLRHLSTLLRQVLQASDRHEVTLAEELALLEPYLEIARTRFGDRLTIERRIGPGLDEALVPQLVLQPLLENAFEHGIARRAGAARVSLEARREGDRLRLTVTDDGAGPNGNGGEGVGLGTTRARLAELYGADAELTVRAGAAGGAVTTLVVPYHTAPVAVAAAAAALA